MTDKDYVIRAAKQLNIDLIKPTRGCPGVLGTDWTSGFGKSVIDAKDWSEARVQLNTFAQQRAA